jgi:hypothetical protein
MRGGHEMGSRGQHPDRGHLVRWCGGEVVRWAWGAVEVQRITVKE